MTSETIAKVLDFKSNNRSTFSMTIFSSNLLKLIPYEEASNFGEESLQLEENGHYEFELSDPNLTLHCENGNHSIVRPSIIPNQSHCGSIEPGFYVGRLSLIAQNLEGAIVGRAAIEIRSRKVDYREHYRKMMSDITERCVSLVMELRSPTALQFAPDPGRSFETIHQRFAFIRSLISSRTFQDALHRITTHPHQRWEPEETICDIRRAFRADAHCLRQIAKGSRRVVLPEQHPLTQSIRSLPERITAYRSVQNDDTPENRFIKFALRSFADFLHKMRRRLDSIGKGQDTNLQTQIKFLENDLESAISADVFRNVSLPDILPLGSPVLQRKEGYREVLQAWLNFDMAAQLVWHGGNDVYGAGQRDIATLYEYWVFFKLLDIVSDIFKLDQPAARELIEKTSDGFGLKLKSGKHLAITGTCQSFGRDLSIEFSYNRTFTDEPNREIVGSWTKKMRPDYSLSLWPYGFAPEEAEAQEMMVHIHFDAKYRVDGLPELFGDNDIDSEKGQEKLGTWKRADLLKMHAYRDAIRRTQGAYVLYPGNDVPTKYCGFSEIIPGLGAFVLKPGSGDNELKQFIIDVVEHVCDRATLMERQTFHLYEINKEPATHRLVQQFPEREPGKATRHSPPTETHVLVAWCRNENHLKWIFSEKLYNCRMDTSNGSLRLKPEIAGASYLLLHGSGREAISGLLRISSNGPRVMSKETLVKRNYPSKPTQDNYLVFDVQPAVEFEKFTWDYSRLVCYEEKGKPAHPYHVTLAELLEAKQPI